MKKPSDVQLEIVRLVASNGSMLMTEIAAGLQARKVFTTWDDLQHDVEWLKRYGYVLFFRDNRARLTNLGKLAATLGAVA